MAVNAHALTTRQRAMDFMGISSLTTTQENVLDRIINSVTDFIEHYTGRRFKLTTYTSEEYDGDNSGFIFTRQYPISSSGSLTLQYRNSSSNEDSWSDIDSEDFFINYNGGYIQGASNIGFAKGIRPYRITYSAGYDYDNSATFLSDIGAADLEYVTWKLVATAFNKRKGELGVESETIRDYSVTYSKEVFEDDEIKSILDKYTRIGVGGLMTPPLY